MSLLPGTFEGMGADPLDMNHGRRANQTRGGTAALDPANIANLQPWQDATYQQATRALDPQFQEAENRFRQQMVNQGFAEGSEGWNRAFDNFSRARNDAYGSARNQALAQALAAQQQGFGQSLSLDQLASQNAATNAAMAGQALDRAQERDFRNREFTEGTRRWDLNRGDFLGQQDFNNMMGMMDFDRGSNQMDNATSMQEFGMNQGLMGFAPNNNPYYSDTYQPYQIQAGAEANRSQAAANQANSTMSTIGQFAGTVLPILAMMCDRNIKDTLGTTDPDTCLDALSRIPLDKWAYQADGVMHIGTYAQDFHRAFGMEERNRIWVGDFLGALLGAVQALKADNDALRSRLDSLTPKRKAA